MASSEMLRSRVSNFPAWWLRFMLHACIALIVPIPLVHWSSSSGGVRTQLRPTNSKSPSTSLGTFTYEASIIVRTPARDAAMDGGSGSFIDCFI